MEMPILSNDDLMSINLWILNLEHQRIKDSATKLKVAAQAEESLNLNYKLIGSGRGRIVFDLYNEYVLKIAISHRGIKSNLREIDIYMHCPDDLRKHLCPVVDFGVGWIIMKKFGSTLPKKKNIIIGLVK
ncbi:hypothetical protein CVD28_06525 [Bacillus sp. M6-12]|uniref:hypothetical protein n=1 Tax=Bacillus sp. M6-12 TaxID=2054166 RepID=UPI000C76AE46|nr:hypothetical protein [Bacillus sp. M6-12]PLS18766.1 hypothetical protein CVD28_06525 [Bacillus sp. M6-12]